METDSNVDDTNRYETPPDQCPNAGKHATTPGVWLALLGTFTGSQIGLAVITALALIMDPDTTPDPTTDYAILVSLSLFGLASCFVQWPIKYADACKAAIVLSMTWYMLAPLVVYIGNAPQ